MVSNVILARFERFAGNVKKTFRIQEASFDQRSYTIKCVHSQIMIVPKFRAKDVLGDAEDYRLWLEGLIGQLVANDTKASSDILVQLFFLSLSGLIGSRYEYERTRISG